jgi:hypothetical protein
MSMISGVQSSAAYLQAVATMTALAPARSADAAPDAASDDGSNGTASTLSGTSQGLTSTRPTDTVGNNVDTFA